MQYVYSRVSTATQSLLRQRHILTEARLLIHTEGITAAEAEGRYRGRPAALAGTQLDEVRAAYRDQGTSIAALAREHGVSRVAVRTALADLLPNPRISPDTR